MPGHPLFREIGKLELRPTPSANMPEDAHCTTVPEPRGGRRDDDQGPSGLLFFLPDFRARDAAHGFPFLISGAFGATSGPGITGFDNPSALTVALLFHYYVLDFVAVLPFSAALAEIDEGGTVFQ